MGARDHSHLSGVNLSTPPASHHRRIACFRVKAGSAISALMSQMESGTSFSNLSRNIRFAPLKTDLRSGGVPHTTVRALTDRIL
jgi:hypothetical protein